jgi:hypothetical protein
MQVKQGMSTATDLKPIDTDVLGDDVDYLSDMSDFDNMEKENNDEQVSGGPSPNGKWELLPRDDEKSADQRSEEKKSFEEELNDRLNTALDASINQADAILKSPSRSSRKNNTTPRRQNATLEDFMSPGRKTKPFGVSKRNRTTDVICISPIVSPPHKTQRSVFAHKQQDSQSKSTTRFIREICQRLNEPKHNLMKKVLQQKGKVFVLDLVAQVDQVEEAGGQFVADGTRRRTKGGVFLNLLKSQISKEQWNKIYEEENEAQKRRKAMKRRLRYAGEAAQAEGNETTTGAEKAPAAVSYKECLTKAVSA